MWAHHNEALPSVQAPPFAREKFNDCFWECLTYGKKKTQMFKRAGIFLALGEVGSWKLRRTVAASVHGISSILPHCSEHCSCLVGIFLIEVYFWRLNLKYSSLGITTRAHRLYLAWGTGLMIRPKRLGWEYQLNWKLISFPKISVLCKKPEILYDLNRGKRACHLGRWVFRVRFNWFRKWKIKGLS